jgi:hypothetical protein
MTAAIRNILNTKMSEIDLAGVTIAWENVPFTPKPNETHLRISYLPGTTRAAANHKNAMDFESGLYQIDVYVPQNLGTALADQITSDIRHHFYRGLRLESPAGHGHGNHPATTVVHIQQTPSENPGAREGAFWRARVTVPWFAYIPAAS